MSAESGAGDEVAVASSLRMLGSLQHPPPVASPAHQPRVALMHCHNCRPTTRILPDYVRIPIAQTSSPSRTS